MIASDLLAVVVIASVPLAPSAGALSIAWILAVIFVASTVSIFFEASEFGAIPSLVGRESILVIDAASFLVSALMLGLIARPLNAPRSRPRRRSGPTYSRGCAMSSGTRCCATSPS